MKLASSLACPSQVIVGISKSFTANVPLIALLPVAAFWIIAEASASFILLSVGIRNLPSADIWDKVRLCSAIVTVPSFNR